MHISPFIASYPREELITSPTSFFSSIKYNYNEYRVNGIYREFEQPGYFAYRITTGGKTQTGLLTMTDVKELKNKRVLKHEKTLAAKEQTMMHRLLQTKALVKPVLLTYKPIKAIQNILDEVTQSEPLLNINFESEDGIHQIWPISDQKTVDTITKSFSKVGKSYIGDGHHRSTTMQLLSKTKELGKEAKKFRRLYTAYFPYDQVTICDYNRVVDISEITSLPEFIVALSKYFDIEPLAEQAKPKKKHHVTFFIDNRWYLMKWKKKYLSKKSKQSVLLDSALINKHVFEEILGIADVRDDTRIKYFGGTLPLKKMEMSSQKRNIGIGICIFPVSVKELTAIADQNQTLPPKSTWFLPRLKSGILAKNL
jgi:uncharacterized protein (DUF1015 family)